MRPIPSSPAFTHREALESGWTQSALTCAIRRGSLRRLRRGVYTAEAGFSPALDAIGAARAYPGAVVSHRSALLLHDLPLVGAAPPLPELTVPPRAAGNLAAVHVHRATLRDDDITEVSDVTMTSVARTLADVSRHRPVATAVAAIDAALRAERVTVTEIEDVLRFCWNWPRVARGHRALRLADARSESALESISRVVLHRLRMPAPEPQANIHDDHRRFVARADFYWDEPGVVGEADGRLKYDDRDVLMREKQRQEELEELGLVVIRWDWADIVRRPNALRARLERGFDRGRLRDRSGFPRLWTL
jgi:very-short-patch-repair endonuclease